MGRSNPKSDEGCTTPKNGECRIPAAFECPPPPRKKQRGLGKKLDPPSKGYFQPPDLDALFHDVGGEAELGRVISTSVS